MIYGWAQALHATPDYILHGISYENLLLYSQASPSYDTKKQEEEWDESIDANNPDNFKSKNDNTDDNDEEEVFI